ncbi:hypothetical protein JCM33374_g2358 [Metschnikowia sp. JCM 33374]|nr:hypothetical protein JCM33374_g2358 [Metschnikowia sp. JCM 33374]
MTKTRMSRPNRKPLFSIIVLLCVSCTIYFMATGDKESLGSAGPLASLKLQPEIESSRADFDPEEFSAKPMPAEEVSTKFTGEQLAETGPQLGKSGTDTGSGNTGLNSDLSAPEEFTETPFMPKMANETLKAQLGNSAWHLFHTILARYPDKPSISEKSTLKQYIHLFAQVYPCGDCARHFTQLLAKYPVQVESRKTAALWGCHIHNKVNERLEKPIYDCTTILEDYDCGCGKDEQEEDSTLGNETVEHLREVKLDEMSGLQRGG